MPRIDAPTVPEHRARQRAAIVAAAEELLCEGGWNAMTFAALGEKTGLARSSVYEYFGSRDEIVLAICEEAFPRWERAVADAVQAVAGDPLRQVEEYVAVQLRMVDRGEHRIGQEIGRAPIDGSLRRKIGALHISWLYVLDQPLAALGIVDTSRFAGLVQGVVEAATRQLEGCDGRSDDGIRRLAVEFVTAAIEHRLGERDGGGRVRRYGDHGL